MTWIETQGVFKQAMFKGGESLVGWLMFRDRF